MNRVLRLLQPNLILPLFMAQPIQHLCPVHLMEIVALACGSLQFVFGLLDLIGEWVPLPLHRVNFTEWIGRVEPRRERSHWNRVIIAFRLQTTRRVRQREIILNGTEFVHAFLGVDGLPQVVLEIAAANEAVQNDLEFGESPFDMRERPNALIRVGSGHPDLLLSTPLEAGRWNKTYLVP